MTLPSRTTMQVATRLVVVLLAACAIAVPGVAGAAAAPTGGITEYRPTGVPGSQPVGIAPGFDGRMWFTDPAGGRLGKMDLNGASASVAGTTTPASTPTGVTANGGSMWFTESGANQVGRTSTDFATMVEFAVPTPASRPSSIVTGPDGNLWFTEPGGNRIGMITATAGAGAVANDYPVTSAFATPTAITSLAGDLWFTEQGTRAIGRMHPNGQMVTENLVPSGSGLTGITGGPDGNLWFTELSGAIGRMTPAGQFTLFTTGTGGPVGLSTAITAGLDGNLYFIDVAHNAIGQATVAGAIQEFPVTHALAFSQSVAPTGITSGPDGNIWFTEQGAAAAIATLSIQPTVTLSATSLDFGIQGSGTTSGRQVVTMTSVGGGSAKVNVSLVDASNFKVTDNCTGATLVPANRSCTLAVAFAPQGAAGSRSATITFGDNAAPGNGVQTIALTGTAAVGTLDLAPSTVDFGAVVPGATGPPFTLTLTNGAIGPIAVASAGITGADPLDFSTTADTCSGTTLAMGQACTFSVAFSPRASGLRAATLRVVDAATNSPQTAMLTGVGAAPNVAFSPAPLDFGRQQIGLASPLRSLAVTNTSGSPIAVSGASLVGPSAGDYAIAVDGCSGTTLAPGGGCTVSLRFTPAAEGLRPAVLILSDDAPDSPQAAGLTGRGVNATGYWLNASDGGIFSYGAAGFLGSTGSSRLNRFIVGMAATPDSRGYWEVATDGGIFAFGDAGFFGSTGATRLNSPIVAMAPTPSGNGYWLVAADGGIFAFGDARFFGSTGSVHLNKPIVAMATTPSGNGYWLAASDGGIFAFGDAAFAGSMGAVRLNRQIVAMASTPTGAGYLLLASDGGVFTFGDAAFEGSAGATRLNQPIVGMAATPTGLGYWLVATDGGIFAFGDATFFGSAGKMRLNKPIVGLAATL